MPRLVLLSLAALAIAAPSLAQTSAPPAEPYGGAPAPGYGQSAAPMRPPATPQVIAARKSARSACAPDIARLCPDAQPGGGGVMKCVREHRSEVAPACGQALMALRDARRAGAS